MRRILLLLAVAAMMLALTAGPVLAQAPAPGQTPDTTPGNPQIPDTSKAEETPLVETDVGTGNCYGDIASNPFKGPGGNPGSMAEPTLFEGAYHYSGEVISGLASDPTDPTGGGNAFSDFQQDTREDFAACGQTA